MIFRSLTLNDHTQARAFIQSSMTTAGYTKNLDSVDFVGYSAKNAFNTLTGTDATFNPVFLLDGADVGLSLAKVLPSTNLIPKADAPKTTISTNFKITMLVTNYTVAIAVTNVSTGSRVVLVAATIDYRELDLSALVSEPTHLNNLRNNGQCVFRVGGSGRILYSGTPVSVTYNAALTLDSPFPNAYTRLMESLEPTLPVCIVLAGTDGRFYGNLKDVYITQNSAPFHRDRGFDQSGRSHVFFRDSNGSAVMLGEV